MMRIRPGVREEVDEIYRIAVSATREMDSQGISQWDDVYPSREMLTDDIAAQHLHVLESDNQMAGFLVIDEDQSPEYSEVDWQYAGQALVVHRLTIDPAFQGRGLGKRLMHFAEDTATTNGYHCIRLDAFIYNPTALALYNGLGYRKAGIVHFRKGPFQCYEKQIALP